MPFLIILFLSQLSTAAVPTEITTPARPTMINIGMPESNFSDYDSNMKICLVSIYNHQSNYKKFNGRFAGSISDLSLSVNPYCNGMTLSVKSEAPGSFTATAENEAGSYSIDGNKMIFKSK